MEYKVNAAAEQVTEGRVVTGLCAVFGNIDLGGDRIFPGAFSKTIAENRKNMVHLWQHDAGNPPTAVIVELKEVGKSALPSDLLASFPEATGGVQVARKYLETPRAEEIFQGIKEKAMRGMSFAYEPVKGKTEYVKGENGTMIRNLHELKMHESSDVNWGMNPAAVASKGYLLWNLLSSAETGQDTVALLRAGQSMTPENINSLQDTITMLITALQGAITDPDGDGDIDNPMSWNQNSAPNVALRKAIAGAKWIGWTPQEVCNLLLTSGEKDSKSGRRNSSDDEKTIKKAIDLLQSLIAADNAAEPSPDTGKALTDRATLLRRLEIAKRTAFIQESF